MSIRRVSCITLAAAVLAGCSDREPLPVAPESPAFAAVVCELGVTDAAALALLADLSAQVDALEAAGTLNSGQARALRNHLGNATRHIEAGRYCPAIAQLEAFRRQVANFRDAGHLTADEAELLIDDVTAVLEGGTALFNQVVVDPPSSAAGTYEATGAVFGPPLTVTGVSGNFQLVNDGTASPTLGCNPLIGFAAGTIAVVERGTCTFVMKVQNAQAAGAIAVVVYNNNPGPPITMGGSDPSIVIPSVMIANPDGLAILAGLPASGTVRNAPSGF